MKRIYIIGLVFLAVALQACMSVKAYQKAYINDDDMKLSSRKVESYEINIHTYREGASGASGGKVGGGCGCN